jgi:hypothetical protein
MGRDVARHTVPPLAERSHPTTTATRVAATLDVVSGQVCGHQGSRAGVRELVGLYQAVRAASPDAARRWVIQENWPVHWHADLLVALQPQTTRWPPTRPARWSDQPSAEAVRRWGDLHLPIHLVFLPTDASWLHPMEQRWR